MALQYKIFVLFVVEKVPFVLPVLRSHRTLPLQRKAHHLIFRLSTANHTRVDGSLILFQHEVQSQLAYLNTDITFLTSKPNTLPKNILRPRVL